MNPTYQMKIWDVPKINTTIVYGWKRNNEYLYIGKSYNGTRRILTNQVMHKREQLDSDDDIVIWKTNEDEINELELKLIKMFKPKFNEFGVRQQRKPMKDREIIGNHLCYNCYKSFKPSRQDKVYCTVKCKSLYWQYRTENQRTIEFIERYFAENDTEYMGPKLINKYKV